MDNRGRRLPTEASISGVCACACVGRRSFNILSPFIVGHSVEFEGIWLGRLLKSII